jgi:predicted transcriptional regulator
MSNISEQARRHRRFMRVLESETPRHNFRGLRIALQRLNAQRKQQSKMSLIEAGIRRSEGASLAELVAATGWQPHSIRGAISRRLRKERGLGVVCSQENGARRYRITAAADFE